MKFIELLGVRQNNLKNINVKIPLHHMTVITGLSGSGKSSLAFETLYGEGQRRFVESLSAYVRQFLEKMPRPELDSINRIPPSIALEQKNNLMSSRSTVGSLSEIFDFMRLLFSKAGNQFCEVCGARVKRIGPQALVDILKSKKNAESFYILFSYEDVETAEEILKRALKSGYSRFLYKNAKSWELERIENHLDETDNLKVENIYILADRFKFDDKLFQNNSARLIDAIENAFKNGNDELAIYYPPKAVTKGGKSSKNFVKIQKGLRCVSCGSEKEPINPNMLSFNSPVGACSHCKGFGHTLEVDPKRVIPDPSKSILDGALDPLEKPSLVESNNDMLAFCRRKKISLTKPWLEISEEKKSFIWEGDRHFPGIVGIFEQMKAVKYKLHVRVFIRRYQTQRICNDCDGTRLKPRARTLKIEAKKFGFKDITEIHELSISDAYKFFQGIKLSEGEKVIAKEPLRQILGRLNFLNRVGVGYLGLNRLSKTLSGGEVQRINLANQLGASLAGTLYVLDEPSIGLHPVDTDRLITALELLRDNGNTVVIVEHDTDVIEKADWIVELGPEAGEKGGNLVYQGELKKFFKSNTLTAVSMRELKERKFKLQTPVLSSPPKGSVLKVKSARLNNIKGINIDLPLNRLVGICGVSGSGKSTLVKNILFKPLSVFVNEGGIPSEMPFKTVNGLEHISEIHLLDQKPIGKSSRSNPLTFMKAYTEVRRIFSQQSSAIREGLKPSDFSFNVDGGRCPICKGDGEINVDLQFIADVKIPCEECDGKRFQKKVLRIKYLNKNIYDILDFTVDQALDFFHRYPLLVTKLGCLKRVGLGYIKIGQSATTLSGGESQRLKIASVLDQKLVKGSLFFFDEPTVGLHLKDVENLLGVFKDLVSEGAGVVFIEHHLEALLAAEWLIEMGPEGGDRGGKVVDSGTVAGIIERAKGPTGLALKKYLNLS